MILLRCISFLTGSLIVTGAPFFLLPDSPQRPSDFAHAIGACLVVALLASGFFLIGVAGNHMKRSRKTRVLAGVLLAFPILGSLAALAIDSQREEVWMVGPLMCGAIFLFITFVYPAKRRRMYRSLRPRDPSAVPTSQN
jgi:UDP-N-acetylmuramyl pentapeptide phosphotransferase/UDP-N-acetylglucosamine-1-phosphate transferase